MMEHYSHRVSPFGHLRINTRVQFPEAFRSLPRPSSPDRAKASSLLLFLSTKKLFFFLADFFFKTLDSIVNQPRE